MIYKINSHRILKIFALTMGGMVFVLGENAVQAQVSDVDLLQPMLPSRPTVALPSGTTTPSSPTPTISLGVLPGHTITPLPDPGFEILPPAPEPAPPSD
jgi:hypothetical protein